MQDETQVYHNKCGHQRCCPSRWKKNQFQLPFNSKW